MTLPQCDLLLVRLRWTFKLALRLGLPVTRTG